MNDGNFNRFEKLGEQHSLGPSRRRVRITIEVNVNDLPNKEGATGAVVTCKAIEGEAEGLITTLEAMEYEPAEVEIVIENLGEIK